MNQQTNFNEDMCTKFQDTQHNSTTFTISSNEAVNSRRSKMGRDDNSSADVTDSHGGQSSSCREYLMLPPMLPEHQGRHTLVLDMDGTILAEKSDEDCYVDFALEQEDTATRTFISLRPNLQQFLQLTSNIYEIVIFTETSKAKADAILDNMVDDIALYVTHRLYGDSCREISGKLVKDISSLGRDIRKVVIVDDCVFRYSLQPRNAISMMRYEGDPNDEELDDLFELLLEMATVEDVRIFLGTQFPELHDSEYGIPKDLEDHIVRTGLFSSRLGSYLCSDLRQRCRKHTLVLDMDDTLLKESWEKLPAGSDYFTVSIDSELGIYSTEKLSSMSDSDSESLITAYVYLRPGLKNFLAEMSRVFQIVIFTMSSADRAAVLLDEINDEKLLSMFLARDFCSAIYGNAFKELQFLGLDMKNVVFIDDLPSMCELYPSNSILIKAFDGHKSDCELTKLIPFLRNLSELEDVRPAIQARHNLPVRAIEVEDN